MKHDKKKTKKVIIQLKTDLPDIEINEELRNWKFNQNDIILNKENSHKKKMFSFHSSIFNKVNKTDSSINSIDFSKFDKIIFDSKSVLNTNENLPLSQLLDDDLYSYIKKIKKLYSHYKRNHRGKRNNSFFLPNEEYNERISVKNLLEDNKEFLDEIEDYKTNDKYLEKDKNELYNIIKEFDLKVGVIENELLYSLFYSEYVVDFVLKNYFIEYNIKRLINSFEQRKKNHEEIKKKFINNNTKIFLFQTKRKNLKTLKEVSNIILDFYNKAKSLKYSSLTVEKERNSILNLQKELVPIKQRFKSKIKLISFIENEMVNITGISESKYINSFIIYIEEIMKLCFSNFNLNESLEKVTLNHKFDLTPSIKNNNSDFKYLSNNNEEIIFYHLINLPSISKEKILSLLEIYSFIISQNFDISQIQEKLKNIFLVIIQEICDKITEKGIDRLKIEGQAFIFLKENFDYLIELFVNNFGTSPKIFKEIIEYIINEAKNKTINLLIKIMEEKVSLLPSNFYETKNIIVDDMSEFFKIFEFNYIEFFNQIENDFIFKFFTSQNDLLEELMENEQWYQINTFNLKYQSITNLISIDYNTITENDLKNISQNKDEKIEYIECRNEKYKIIPTTLFVLDFIYQVYYILFYNKNKNEIQTIILQLVKILHNFTIKCNLSIIEGIGKIGKEKRIITEKEYILLNSNLSFIQSILFNINSYITGDNDDEIINLINKHIKKINLIHLKCLEIVNAIIDELKIDVINKFDKLNFMQYPILEIQGYNDFVIRFTKFEEIYYNMINAFNDNDIINIFTKILNKFFNEFDEKYFNKTGFGNEDMLNQFKKDILYIKDIIMKMKLLNNENYLEKLDNIINISKIEIKFNENDLIIINDNPNDLENKNGLVNNDNKNIKNINNVDKKEEMKEKENKKEDKKEVKKEKENNKKDNKKEIKEKENKKEIKSEKEIKKEENKKEEKNPKEKKFNKLFNKINKFTGRFIKNKGKQEKEENNITEKVKSIENQNKNFENIKEDKKEDIKEEKLDNDSKENNNLIDLNFNIEEKRIESLKNKENLNNDIESIFHNNSHNTFSKNISLIHYDNTLNNEKEVKKEDKINNEVQLDFDYLTNINEETKNTTTNETNFQNLNELNKTNENNNENEKSNKNMNLIFYN